MRRKRKRKSKLIYFRLVSIAIVLLLSVIGLRGTISKYKSSGSSTANVDLAYYVVEATNISQSIKLDSILPRSEKYIYTFSVSNHNATQRTETALEYTIQIKTTTNLHLNYEVTLQGENTNLITNTTTTADDDGTYFKTMTVTGDTFGFSADETNTYELKIEFPASYSSAEYEGIVEYLQITINSNQVFE